MLCTYLRLQNRILLDLVVQTLVMHDGPLRRIVYVLWAIAQNVIVRYGPQRRISLSAMSCGAESLSRAQNHTNLN
jgi:hypothetical protein